MGAILAADQKGHFALEMNLCGLKLREDINCAEDQPDRTAIVWRHQPQVLFGLSFSDVRPA